jgi:hypothetical protein
LSIFVRARSQGFVPSTAGRAGLPRLDQAARSFLSAGAAHPFVIVCGIRDGPALARCLDRIRSSGIAHRAFYEPDIGGQLTAIATEPVRPEQRRFFRKYQLLRGPREVQAARFTGDHS